ncbi:MAG: flagellar biosynthetic protein FliQ [Candidatus Eremiobacteraeota bacterium]|nr:flagellar biosynthetic protein FliQ [Candidatus Eremiobacteraeota bacterium]
MESAALSLYMHALEITVLLVLPAVLIIAAIGVIVGLFQTVVQVQDQNVSFAPKLAAVVIMAAVAGAPALALLRKFLLAALEALPRLTR